MIRSRRAILLFFTVFFIITGYSQVILWKKYLTGNAVLGGAASYISAIKEDPLNAGLQMSLGLIYNKTAARDKVKIQIERALKLDPVNPDTHFAAGKIFMEMGDKENAYKSFRQSIALSDRYENAILNIVFESNGQWQEAEKVVPDGAHSKFIFAKFLNEKGMWQEAKAQFSAAMAAQPGLPKYYYEYFIYRSSERKDYDYMLAVADSYTRAKSEDLFILRQLGYAYMSKGDYKKAEDIYIKVLNVNKEDTESLNYMGQIYYHNKGPLAAVSYYKDMISKRKAGAQTYAFLGKIYYSEGKYEPALENFKKTVELNPKDFWARCELGLTYFNLGKYNKAISAYRECLKTKPDELEVLRYLAMALEKNGDLDEAQNIYKKIEQQKQP